MGIYINFQQNFKQHRKSADGSVQRCVVIRVLSKDNFFLIFQKIEDKVHETMQQKMHLILRIHVKFRKK